MLSKCFVLVGFLSVGLVASIKMLPDLEGSVNFATLKLIAEKQSYTVIPVQEYDNLNQTIEMYKKKADEVESMKMTSHGLSKENQTNNQKIADLYREIDNWKLQVRNMEEALKLLDSNYLEDTRRLKVNLKSEREESIKAANRSLVLNREVTKLKGEAANLKDELLKQQDKHRIEVQNAVAHETQAYRVALKERLNEITALKTENAQLEGQLAELQQTKKNNSAAGPEEKPVDNSAFEPKKTKYQKFKDLLLFAKRFFGPKIFVTLFTLAGVVLLARYTVFGRALWQNLHLIVGRFFGKTNNANL